MLYIPMTNIVLLAAKQEPYKKKPIFQRKVLKNFWERSQENGSAGRRRKKDRTERVRELGRRTRE